MDGRGATGDNRDADNRSSRLHPISFCWPFLQICGEGVFGHLTAFHRVHKGLDFFELLSIELLFGDDGLELLVPLLLLLFEELNGDVRGLGDSQILLELLDLVF